MRPDPAAYEDLLSSLADGLPVDWAGLEAGAQDDRERRQYRNLRLVARVAELHQTLTLDEEPVEPRPAEEVTGPLATWGRLQVRDAAGVGRVRRPLPRTRSAARARRRAEAPAPAPGGRDRRGCWTRRGPSHVSRIPMS